MVKWDGKERRGMDRDWIERDRLLTEVFENTKFIKETLTSQKEAFDNHIIHDSAQFSSIKKRIFYLTIAVVVIGVVLGGPSFALMFIK